MGNIGDEFTRNGTPFPLFRAPLQTVHGTNKSGRCALCERDFLHLFDIGLNDYLVQPCRECRSPVGHRIGWSEEVPGIAKCPRCKTHNRWPARLPRSFSVCYECLHAGKVAVSHEFEGGHVEYGLTIQKLARVHSGRDARAHGFQTKILKRYGDGSRSYGAYFPVAALMELHRTPRYMAMQREYWPFHCGHFMTFLGNWDQDDFNRAFDGEGFALFRRWASWPEMAEDWWDWLEGGVGVSYVHHCEGCKSYRIFVDSD